MRCLNYLDVLHLKECFDDIYTQCISLRILTFRKIYGDDKFKKIENMIESVKLNQIPRTSPLTLMLKEVDIETAVKAINKFD